MVLEKAGKSNLMASTLTSAIAFAGSILPHFPGGLIRKYHMDAGAEGV
jgi:hypothetical protein